jgi:hypothetical protein
VRFEHPDERLSSCLGTKNVGSRLKDSPSSC